MAPVLKIPQSTSCSASAIEKLIHEKLMAPYQIPGVALVASYKNRTVVNQAFGKANTQANVPASTTRLHRIASISKVFTKVAIKHLIT